MVVISNHCVDPLIGTRQFNFSITAKNTARRGSPSNRHTVRRPRKLLTTARVLKFTPDYVSGGEFYNSDIIHGSGVFWEYFRWWIDIPDNTVLSGFAKWRPELYGFSFPFTQIKPRGECNIDEHWQCFSPCLSSDDEEGSTLSYVYSVSPGQFSFSKGDDLIEVAKPRLRRGSGALSASFISGGSVSLLEYVGRVKSIYGQDVTLKLSSVTGTENQATAFITVLGPGEFVYLDAEGEATSSFSEACSYIYDYVPVHRIDVYKCSVPVDDKTDCSGLPPGWYIRVCLVWEFPPETINSLCRTFFLRGPIGFPGEGSTQIAALMNQALSVIFGFVNQVLSALLTKVLDKLPPNAKIIGRLILFFIDAIGLKVTGQLFFCPGTSDLPPEIAPQPISLCPDKSYPQFTEPYA